MNHLINKQISKNNLTQLFLIITLSLVLNACGDSDDDSGPLPPPPPQQNIPAPQPQPHQPFDPNFPQQPGGSAPHEGIPLRPGVNIVMTEKDFQGNNYLPFPGMTSPKYKVLPGDIISIHGRVQGGRFSYRLFNNGSCKALTSSSTYIYYSIGGRPQQFPLNSRSRKYNEHTIQQEGVLDFNNPSNIFGTPYACAKFENFSIRVTRHQDPQCHQDPQLQNQNQYQNPNQNRFDRNNPNDYPNDDQIYY